MRRIVAIGVVLAVCAALPASAPAAPEAPVGFRLRASAGFSVHAIPYDGDGMGEPDELLLIVSRGRTGVTYLFKRGVEVSEGTVRASLGSLGSVDLAFVASGEPKRERTSCGPPLQIDSGFFVGHFDFEGEEGYTQAHATRAAGEDRAIAGFVCAGETSTTGVGGHAPGAQLKAHWKWGRTKLEFEATKSSPGRPARFLATIAEPRSEGAVTRTVAAAAGPSAFKFDVAAQSALIDPPAPFAGVARFTRRGKARGRLGGTLTVDFPGRSDVRLAGARGSLVRWVANPGHPFRPLALTP